jgi:hypothetical protein
VVWRRKTSSETHETSVNRAGHSLERNERDARMAIVAGRMASRRTQGKSANISESGTECDD